MALAPCPAGLPVPTRSIRPAETRLRYRWKWLTESCATWCGTDTAAQASLSMMWELVQGQDLETVHGLEQDFNEMMHSRGRGVDEDLLDRLGDASSLEGVSRYVNRVKCALLGWMALKDALAQAVATDGTGGGTQTASHCDPKVMNRTCDPETPQTTKE